MSCFIVAAFESDMFRWGGLSGHRRSSEDSEDVSVLGLDGAELGSELFGWSEGELFPDGVASECDRSEGGLLSEGVVSEREGLEWGGVVREAELGCAEEVSGESLAVKTGGISGGSVVRFCILLD